MRRVRSGFTLLEAVVALAVVSIVCVGVLAAEGTALRAEYTAAERVSLAAIAEERVVHLDLYAGPLSVLPDSIAAGRADDDVTWALRAREVTGARGLWDVTVIVARNGDAYTLATRRFRPAPLGTP
jgi:prepilin-type N-terminal cleavage/methylation domain-containing protein